MVTIELIGRIVADAELKQFSDNTKYVTFRFAAQNLSKKGQDGKPLTFWANILSTQTHHVIMKQYLTQGKALFIRGTFDYNIYTTKNGIQEVGFNVRANEITLLPVPSEGPKTTVTLPNGLTAQVSSGVVEAHGYKQVSQQPQTPQNIVPQPSVVQPQQPIQQQFQQSGQMVAPQVMPQQPAPQVYQQMVSTQPVQNPAPIQTAVNPKLYDDPADTLPF